MPEKQPYVTLEGSRRFHRAGATVLGPADAHAWFEVTVKLRRKTALPEPQAGKALLTREELLDRHSADPKDLDAVVRVLAAQGLTITGSDLGTRSVKAGGDVETMERVFGVDLLRVKHENVLFRGRVGSVQLPAELDGLVVGVFGLDDRPMIRHRAPMRAHASSKLPPPNQRAWFLPQELADAYQFPAGTGAGQTIGILEFGGRYIAKDLQTFAQFAGLTSTPSVVVRNVHTLAPQEQNDPDAIGETMLDIEVVAGVCPKAAITVFFSEWSEQGWVDALAAALHDPSRPSVISISYGLAEGDDIWTDQAISVVNDSLQEAAVLGIPVCVSAGDDGSQDQVADGRAHVDFPASSPYVLSIGGTALVRSTGKEVVWFDGDGLRQDKGGSTGGGVSSVFPRPAWQKFDIPSVNPSALAGRIVPDVAANAAGSTGYFMVAQDTREVSGGTSASTPLWAALIARLQEGGKTVGYFTPTLYAPGPKTGGQPLGAVACRDVTEGNNSTSAAGGYSAGPGFDAVTGWGSPKGADLMANLT
jgi:kumamolisin